MKILDILKRFRGKIAAAFVSIGLISSSVPALGAPQKDIEPNNKNAITEDINSKVNDDIIKAIKNIVDEEVINRYNAGKIEYNDIEKEKNMGYAMGIERYTGGKCTYKNGEIVNVQEQIQNEEIGRKDDITSSSALDIQEETTSSSAISINGALYKYDGKEITDETTIDEIMNSLDKEILNQKIGIYKTNDVYNTVSLEEYTKNVLEILEKKYKENENLDYITQRFGIDEYKSNFSSFEEAVTYFLRNTKVKKPYENYNKEKEVKEYIENKEKQLLENNEEINKEQIELEAYNTYGIYNVLDIFDENDLERSKEISYAISYLGQPDSITELTDDKMLDELGLIETRNRYQEKINEINANPELREKYGLKDGYNLTLEGKYIDPIFEKMYNLSALEEAVFKEAGQEISVERKNSNGSTEKNFKEYIAKNKNTLKNSNEQLIYDVNVNHFENYVSEKEYNKMKEINGLDLSYEEFQKNELKGIENASIGGSGSIVILDKNKIYPILSKGASLENYLKEKASVGAFVRTTSEMGVAYTCVPINEETNILNSNYSHELKHNTYKYKANYENSSKWGFMPCIEEEAATIAEAKAEINGTMATFNKDHESKKIRTSSTYDTEIAIGNVLRYFYGTDNSLQKIDQGEETIYGLLENNPEIYKMIWQLKCDTNVGYGMNLDYKQSIKSLVECKDSVNKMRYTIENIDTISNDIKSIEESNNENLKIDYLLNNTKENRQRYLNVFEEIKQGDQVKIDTLEEIKDDDFEKIDYQKNIDNYEIIKMYLNEDDNSKKIDLANKYLFNNIEINEYNYKNGMISEQEYNMQKENYKRDIEINTLMKIKGEISEEHIEKVSKSFLYKIDSDFNNNKEYTEDVKNRIENNVQISDNDADKINGLFNEIMDDLTENEKDGEECYKNIIKNNKEEYDNKKLEIAKINYNKTNTIQEMNSAILNDAYSKSFKFLEQGNYKSAINAIENAKKYITVDRANIVNNGICEFIVRQDYQLEPGQGSIFSDNTNEYLTELNKIKDYCKEKLDEKDMER